MKHLLKVIENHTTSHRKFKSQEFSWKLEKITQPLLKNILNFRQHLLKIIENHATSPKTYWKSCKLFWKLMKITQPPLKIIENHTTSPKYYWKSRNLPWKLLKLWKLTSKSLKHLLKNHIHHYNNINTNSPTQGNTRPS